MQAIIAELTAAHAGEAALLWELLHDGAEGDDLRPRITAHLAGMLSGAARGADPLAAFEAPLRDADLFPAAWLAHRRGAAAPQAAADDPDGAAAIADAQAWA